MATTKKDVFKTLSSIDVSDHVQKKAGLSYLSWSWAWSTLKNYYPDTPVPRETLYQEMLLTKNGYQLTDRQVPYLTTPTGTLVESTVTIEGNDYTEQLYVMDNRNKPIINPNQQQIDKTKKRCEVKAIALAGLGINLYAGEDLPIGDINQNDKKQAEAKQAQAKATKEQQELNKLAAEYNQKLTTAAQILKDSPRAIEKQVVKACKEEVPDYKTFDKKQQLEQWIRGLNGMIEKEAQGDLLEEAD